MKTRRVLLKLVFHYKTFFIHLNCNNEILTCEAYEAQLFFSLLHESD